MTDRTPRPTGDPEANTVKLKRLWSRIDPDKPLDDLSLYVESPQSPTGQILKKLAASLDAQRSAGLRDPHGKYLMLGCRGGGKSTELRRLLRDLRQADGYLVETVDLDATGVTASQVSAADLLYLCAVRLLRHLPTDVAESNFARLKSAYAPDGADQLGSLREALGGLRGFGAVTGALIGGAAGNAAAGAAAGGFIVDLVRSGIALWTDRKAAVSESSPQGLRLLEICRDIVEAVQAEDRRGRPICLLIDGLEKMNGEANDRFRVVFEDTRLIAEAPWSAVIAAPPSTLTTGSSADALGYSTCIVWGFPDQPELLVRMVHARRRDGELPEATMPADAIERMVEMCGGLPRHLMGIFAHALWAAAEDGRGVLDRGHADQGVRTFGQELARGLDEDDFATLRKLIDTGRLPQRQRSTSLFAGGRILAEPPSDLFIRYRVHPILEPAIRRLDAQ